MAFLGERTFASTTETAQKSTTTDNDDYDPYKSSSFIGHSLWMCPGGTSNDAYSSVIAETSSKLGTFQFTPHITLVAAMMTGEEDVVERTKKLAKQLAPYKFDLDVVSQRDAYFQCVFAKMKTTQQVMDANALAREFFPERKSDPEYTPHLSLVYGDFGLEEKKTKLIPEIESLLEKNTAETTSFQVDSIEVWSTQGDVKDWYLVEKIPLQGDGNGYCASS